MFTEVLGSISHDGNDYMQPFSFGDSQSELDNGNEYM